MSMFKPNTLLDGAHYPNVAIYTSGLVTVTCFEINLWTKFDCSLYQKYPCHVLVIVAFLYDTSNNAGICTYFSVHST